MNQPSARVASVRETLFGTSIDDPYRWMEDWHGEELHAWVTAQGAYARQYLDALPQRAALHQRIASLNAAGTTVTTLRLAAGRAFYLRRDPGENLAKLVVHRSLDAPASVLVDPNRLVDTTHSAIDWYAPSPAGRSVAYGISEGGSEASVLHVLDVATGATLPDTITRTTYGGVNWLPDGTAFLYNRSPDPQTDEGSAGPYLNSRVYLHRLGDDLEQDIAVLGHNVSTGMEFDAIDIPFVRLSPGSTWMIGQILHGDLSEISLYAAPLAALEDPAVCSWTRIAAVEDAVESFVFCGDSIYLRTHSAAPRYRVVSVSLSRPDLASAPVVVPEGTAVIVDLLIAGSFLLTHELVGGLARMRRVSLTDGQIEEVPLPVDGTILGWAGDVESTSALVQLTSWTVSPGVYHYDVERNILEDSGWQPSSPVDFGALEAKETHVPSKDGTLVPLSIIHRRGLQLDGTNPTLLNGYGAYGITLNPAFLPHLLAWYERGGVLAVAHMRGGGEYGKAWHEAGQKLRKQNTIDDFIACAEHLIARGYTQPTRLAGTGTSAGGIPSSNALVQRPELWAAMVIRVGVTNPLRFEFTENGPPNVPEMGSVATEAGFRGLYAVDAYSHVQDGTAYPAVLLTTGLNDPRVVVWQATKLAARLQAASSSGKPIVLRIEAQGGHGMGATREQVDAEWADIMAFLLHMFGMA